MAESRLATHYDSLKVARNSPVEVIRAAYRALCQKYHPDKHPDRERAERIMKIINQAYEVLTDPVRRQEHDAWIAEQEALKAAEETRKAEAQRQLAESIEKERQLAESIARQTREKSRQVDGKAADASPPTKSKNGGSGFVHKYRAGVKAFVGGLIGAENKQRTPLWAYIFGPVTIVYIVLFIVLKWCLNRIGQFVGWSISTMSKLWWVIVLVGIGVGLSELQTPGETKTQVRPQVISTESDRHQAAAQTNAVKSIARHELSVSYPHYDIDSGIFSGRVTNNSKFTLQDFSVSIQIIDCAPSCMIVGDRALGISVYVPPGQARDFASGAIASLPIPGDVPTFRGSGKYQWSIIGATPDM